MKNLKNLFLIGGLAGSLGIFGNAFGQPSYNLDTKEANVILDSQSKNGKSQKISVNMSFSNYDAAISYRYVDLCKPIYKICGTCPQELNEMEAYSIVNGKYEKVKCSKKELKKMFRKIKKGTRHWLPGTYKLNQIKPFIFNYHPQKN